MALAGAAALALAATLAACGTRERGDLPPPAHHVGAGTDDVRQALHGLVEVAGNGEGGVRGRFDLSFDGGDTLRGTFALAPSEEAR